MKYSAPQPFREALAQAQQKTLLPTSLGTADLNKLSADIRERSRFSAKVRSAEHLQQIDDVVNDIAAGQLDFATGRLRIKQYLQSVGHIAPDGKEGTLQDFGSEARINLQLRVNVQQAQGYGWWKQGQDADLLDAFPAQEFLRVESREHPRTDWGERWDAARVIAGVRGTTSSKSGRMVALKNHKIWVTLSRFHTPYEPFDYNSGMGVEDVDREDAIALKLIDRDTQIFPQDRPFNEDLQATPDIRSDKLRALLEQSGVGRFNQDGVFTYRSKRGGPGTN